MAATIANELIVSARRSDCLDMFVSFRRSYARASTVPGLG
jgi:hypothetical protein